MHSSELKAADFQLTWRGETLAHAAFFAGVPDTVRLGVVAPAGCDGLGAITLIMAYVTAFYDRYRERGGEFYAYPDFFTFQRRVVCADYAMCDIWPQHKNVAVSERAQQTLEAITDRGIDVLVVPDEQVRQNTFAPVEAESARRTIKRCFAYSGGGAVASADLKIACESRLVGAYGAAVLDSVPEDAGVRQAREQWTTWMKGETLRQSFREITRDEALQRL